MSHACAAYWRQCLPEMTAAKEKAFFAAYSVSTVVNQLPLDDAAAAAWGAAKHVPATAELANLHFARAEVVATIIRDIFGNPFRPVAFSPSWRTSTAIAIASQMYESRDFSAMPILADALQDAGCDNANVLDHCRSPGPHVRGCWVVDLVLGKE
ncbi:hypothetical protein [Gemmata palustris]|uniref:hypothetical protein n=1 Tax=Gemmata palustris TaxID=2822762 RepID=UPI0028F42C0F|nr:hypothetical protein [Gemmata palustris]